MNADPSPFTAVVMAADRNPDDPVARAGGAPCKSLAPVGGVPMLFRVLEALSTSRSVGRVILCGPPRQILEKEPDLAARIGPGKAEWIEHRATPSESATHALEGLPEDVPVLITTSDHALLSPRIVDHFCSEALASGCDVVAAAALHETVKAAYPETRRTAYRLADAAYCSCNLYAFLTARGREAAKFWRRIESRRKSPLRVIQVFGWVPVLRFLAGRLSLREATDRLSARLGCKAGIVTLPFPEAAIDVDTPEDLALVRRIVSEGRPGAPSA